jgi:hypothetical protein
MPTATTLIATKIGTAIVVVVVVVVIIVTLTTVIVAIPRNMARIPTIETANTVVIVVAAAETTGGGSAAFDRSATGGSNFNSLVLVFSQ